jgi:transcription elongation GreA/GreB family factor
VIDKNDLIAQLTAHVNASVRDARMAMDAATVVTPSSPIGKAVLGCVAGDVVEILAAGQKREWTVSYVG